MSVVPRICYLNPRVIGREQIQLSHEENVLIDGSEMFPDTIEVSDLRIIAMANCDAGYVIVQVTGSVHCRHKGRVLTKGAKYMFGPGNVIQMYGEQWEYDYEICFIPPMPDHVVQSDLPMILEKTTFEPQYLTNYQQSTWQEYDNEKVLIYTPHMLNHSSGIAAYSLDDVLVKTSTWTLKYDNIERRLTKMYNKEYKLAIFVNHIAMAKGTLQTFKDKIEAFLNQIGIPMQVFICTGETKYKKPIPFMWRVMEQYNENITIEPDRCFYVGSSVDLTDRLFAANLNIRFFTGDEYFKLHSSPVPQMPAFNPTIAQENNFSLVVAATQEVLVIVGPPCSGKTLFYKNYLRDYHYSYIDGTTNNTTAKLQRLLKTTKRSIFIDGTNPTKTIRQKFIKITNEFDVPCRCFLMDVSRVQARHINKLRELTGTRVKANLDVALDQFYAAYETPRVSEGFSTVVLVPFVPRYEDEEQKNLYHYYLLAD